MKGGSPHVQIQIGGKLSKEENKQVSGVLGTPSKLTPSPGSSKNIGPNISSYLHKVKHPFMMQKLGNIVEEEEEERQEE